MGYTKIDKTPADFLESARETLMMVASSIQNASEPLTLEAICELISLAEEGLTALNAACNVTLDSTPDEPEPDPAYDFELTGDAGPMTSVFLLHPLTPEAHEWIEENIGNDAQWFGDALAVEHGCVENIIEAIETSCLAIKKTITG